MNQPQNQDGERNPNWKGGKLKKVCPTCGIHFETWPSANRTYCKNACRPRGGAHNPKWRGGTLLLGGYRYLSAPDHPNRTKAGYVAEHRLVMEQHLGRYLERHEAVHHRNHDTLDNRPENLQLCPSNGKHSAEFHIRRDPATGRFA